MEARCRYGALSRISSIQYGNGVETAYAYDEDGNISNLEIKAGEKVLLSFAYQYDGNGNRTVKIGTQASAVLGGITAGNNALDISYSYDVRGQLLEERRNGASVSYAYDKAGNRIRKTDSKGATLYRYNGKNQLNEEENSDGKNQFTYDRQGGIVEEKNPVGIRLFSYDSRHQQTKVETESGNVQENRYDVENLRFELLENGRRTSFVYHNGELLHEEGREEQKTSYHLGAGIDAFQRGGETCYYQQDEQLSTAFITGGQGEIQNSYQYDAFGVHLEATEQLYNCIRYTGQQYDELAEQNYLRARYYNPMLGRFMQEDIYQDDGLNLYAYCKNNPVVFYDPSGYEGYYFRGTTEGFGGRRDYDFTFTSTDPSVAIAYAVRGQTETGLPGIVYIATDSDLAGINTETWYGSIPTDKEVYVHMSPDEFANAASISLEVSQARDILKDTTGVEVSSHIYGEEGLRAQLEDNYNKIKEDDINKFVEEARVVNNADATEDADVTKDTPCS